jgi:DNA-binding XRE family transcriptional regulator
MGFRADLRKHPFWSIFPWLGLVDSLTFPYNGFMTTPTQSPAPKARRQYEDTDWERTGQTLRQLRLKMDVTQAELATAIGYRNQSSIVNIERGIKPLPDGKLIKAARYLGVPPLSIRRPKPGATEDDE